jgi:hypothetical protein
MRIVWVERGPVEFSRAFSVRKLRRPLISSGCFDVLCYAIEAWQETMELLLDQFAVLKRSSFSDRKFTAGEKELRLKLFVCALVYVLKVRKWLVFFMGMGGSCAVENCSYWTARNRLFRLVYKCRQIQTGRCGFGEAPESYRVQVAAEELNRTNLDIDETNNNRLCRPVTIALLADGDYNDSSLPHR